ncbi:M20 family metallopeptidase [Arthrobacter crystallopoietes]|uniref:M20 family metallopeptidase n=1 Tax=Crystallibacter crystallopoietes TaxID=37928 RepID=UPI001ABDA51A|nr:M20 family metallopeptidase [Arthrobacter crystallopoietes]QTG81684.1 M20 family metallopeptidase [Arthrobacter crystallopoietes]
MNANQNIRATIIRTVETCSHLLIELSKSIGNRPELAFEEFHAAAEIADVLENNGFDVTRSAYGLPTAVEAVYGNGDCTVAVLAEYDALPGIGHACGHNVIAGAAVGAVLALKPVAEELNLRIKLLGTPAEEKGGGKILMLERGAWDDTDFSLMVHGATGAQTPCASFRTQAYEHLAVTFTGRTAHAAAAPHEGVNAGDAATLAQVALGLLRQQLKPTVVVASFVVSGGAATNIIPGKTNLQVEIRAFDEDDWLDASARVRSCLEGAAIATGCQVVIEQTEIPYAPMRQHDDIAAYWDNNIEQLGYTLETTGGMGSGSTDMGNISQFLPAIHPCITFANCDAVPHTIEFAQAAVSQTGDTAMIDGAKALALTVADVARNQQLTDHLTELRHARSAQAVVTTHA